MQRMNFAVSMHYTTIRLTLMLEKNRLGRRAGQHAARRGLKLGGAVCLLHRHNITEVVVLSDATGF